MPYTFLPHKKAGFLLLGVMASTLEIRNAAK